MKRFVSIVVSVALCLIVGMLGKMGKLGKYKIPIVPTIPTIPIITQRITPPQFLPPHCYLLFCIIMMLL